MSITEIAPSLRHLGDLARSGCLPATAEIEATLHHAHADILAMRSLLMRALGVRQD